MNLSNLKLLRGRVLLEAAFDPEKSGSLFLPPAFGERYPQAGWVIAKGELSEDLELGDLVVVPVEGDLIGLTYHQALRLDLKDFGHLLVDAETEPIIREAFLEYQKTREESTVKVLSVEREHYSFLTSDILEINLIDLSNPSFESSYIPATFIRFRDSGGLERLYYLIREEEILCKLESW